MIENEHSISSVRVYLFFFASLRQDMRKTLNAIYYIFEYKFCRWSDCGWPPFCLDAPLHLHTAVLLVFCVCRVFMCSASFFMRTIQKQFFISN